jgi:hypothetical protein
MTKDLSAGYTSARGGEECVPCPDGATCPGFRDNVQTIPRPAMGYWGDPAYPTVFYECKSASTCASDFYCGAGHMGRMCAEPLTGYFTVGHMWYLKCPAGAGPSAALTVFLTIGVVWVWLRIMNLAEGSIYDSFDVGIKFLHFVGFVAQFPLRWHPNLDAVILMLLVANLEVDFISPHCIWPSFNGLTLFYFQLVVPFVIVAVATLFWAAAGALRGNSAQHEKPLKDPLLNRMFVRDGSIAVLSWRTYVINKSLQVFGFMYQVLAYRAFSSFICKTHPSGSFLKFFPDVQCGSSVHNTMMAVAVLYFVFVLLAMPAVMLWILLQGRAQNMLFEPKFSQRYGTFYEQFKVEYVWWELVYLARKLCISLILALIDVPMIQGALAILLVYVSIMVHMSSQPFDEERNNTLETVCLFCALAFIVCGMIFYPSLDSSSNCVGTDSDQTSFSDRCASTMSIKQSFSFALMCLIVATFVLSIACTLYEVYERRLASAACRSIESIQPWFGKDDKSEFKRTHRPVSLRKGRLGRSISLQGTPSSPRLIAEISSESASSFAGLDDHTNSSGESPRRSSSTGGVVSSSPRAEPQHSLRLHLSHMLVGTYLSNWRSWLKEMEKTEENIKTKYGQRDPRSGLASQERAYVKVDSLLPASSCRFAASLGNGSNSTLSAVSRMLMEAFPGLLDYMATADDTPRNGIFTFLQDYLSFLNTRPVFDNGPGREVILNLDYVSVLADWLLVCEQRDLEVYRCMINDLAAAAGMNLLLKASARRSSAFETLMQIRRANTDGAAAASTIGSRRGSVAAETMLTIKANNDRDLERNAEPGKVISDDGEKSSSAEEKGVTAVFVGLVSPSVAVDETLVIDKQFFEQGSAAGISTAENVAEIAAGGVFSDRDLSSRQTESPGDRNRSLISKARNEANGSSNEAQEYTSSAARGLGSSSDSSGCADECAATIPSAVATMMTEASESMVACWPLPQSLVGGATTGPTSAVRPVPENNVHAQAGQTKSNTTGTEDRTFIMAGSSQTQHYQTESQSTPRQNSAVALNTQSVYQAPREPTPRLGPTIIPQLFARAPSQSLTPALTPAPEEVWLAPRPVAARPLFQSKPADMTPGATYSILSSEFQIATGTGTGDQAWECCSPQRLQAVMAAGQSVPSTPRRPGAGPGGRPVDVWALGQSDGQGASLDPREHYSPHVGLRPLPPPPRTPAQAQTDDGNSSELDRAWMSMNERLRATWRAMSPR